MIYQQIDDGIREALDKLDAKIAATVFERESKRQESKTTDSKNREKELIEELKGLRNLESYLQGESSCLREAEFKRLLAEEYGLRLDHPKFDKVYSLAYQYGHSSGFSDIENYFMDLVDLVR